MSARLDTELARLLFRQAPLGSYSLYLMLAIVVFLFWDQVPPLWLLGWAAASLLGTTLLLLLVVRFASQPEQMDPATWVRRYIRLLLVQDLAWGMIGPLSFLAEDPLYRMVALFMLGRMCAGAVTTRAIVFRAYLVSVGALLAPILVTLALQADRLSYAMLALTIVFVLFMLPVASNYGQSIRKSTRLWLDNEELVAELTRSKGEIEAANRVFLAEIEHRRRIEGELVGARRRAEQASAAKNQFLANISHELRTPLNGIVGFGALLGKAGLPGAQGEYVERIRQSANTLLCIVNDVLDITSIEAGHLTLHERPFSLRAEVDEVVAVARTAADAKGLVLTVAMADDVPPTLLGDADRLKQVLSNLLGNAIKYTERGAVTLDVTAQATGDEETRIAFRVKDTGIGIPAAARETLFENFTRAEAFEKKRYEGVGLGLAIVKRLLDAMGGTVAFDSVEGAGSTFTFSLPLRHHHARAHTAVPERLAPENLNGLRALVVDDNAMNRMVLAALLRQHGVDCTEAADGPTALRLVAEARFDVALIDIQMPDMTGIEVARRLIARQRPVPPLVAVTAHAFPEERREIIGAGFADCLIKPITEGELLRVLGLLREPGAASGEVQPSPVSA